MKTATRFVAIIVTSLFSTNFAVAASLSNNFNITVNSDTSMWSYRTVETGRDGNYSLLPDNTRSANDLWFPGGFSNPPSMWNGGGNSYWGIGRNDTGATQNAVDGAGGTVTWQPGEVLLHPSPNGIVISWLASTNTTATPSFQIADALDYTNTSGQGNGVGWILEHRLADNTDAGILSQSSVGEGSNTGLMVLSSLAVSVGDRLNLIVDFNGAGDGDITQVEFIVNVAQIPEPSAIALLGIGIVLSGSLVRRQQESRK